MKLNKKDFDIGYVGQWESCRDYFVGIQWLESEKEGEDIRDQILQNQESAEAFKELMDRGYIRVKKDYWLKQEAIVERLKKQIEYSDKEDVIEILQKILGDN